MYKKIIIIISFFISSIMGNNYTISPVVKSFIMPGWGEKALDNSKRSRLFSNIEISLWTVCMSSYTFSYHQMLKYKSFAVEHAGISSGGRDKKYWVDIGNYNSNYDYDAEHLRMRDGEESKWDLQPWEWNRAGNRKKFEKMRIDSDKLYFASRFLIGGIILNHIVSGIHSLYLSRNQNDLGSNYSLYPQINYHKNDIFYQLNIDFRI